MKRCGSPSFFQRLSASPGWHPGGVFFRLCAAALLAAALPGPAACAAAEKRPAAVKERISAPAQPPAPSTRPTPPTSSTRPAPSTLSTSSTPSSEIRALWVTRWDYRTEADIKAIVRNAASLGCNRLFFQVRGEATCYFPSRVEPWAWELSEGGVASTGRDPGWDPLQTAIREAHARGLELHAYMNVLTAWKQTQPPPRASGHVFAARPEWLMVDALGRALSPERDKFYAFLNPALPEVRAHLVQVYSDVARRYPGLSGIHLDYLRYPGEMGDYSHDATSLSAFRRFSGGASPKDAPDAWNRWRAAQIDQLLSDLSRAIRAANPSLEISCAVVADYRKAVEQKGQVWLEWPGLGLVDAVAPMAYHYQDAAYEALLAQFLGARRPSRGKVIVGIWPAEHWRARGYDPAMLGRQIALARRMGADGVSLFAYSVFFPNHEPNAWAAYVRTNWFH